MNRLTIQQAEAEARWRWGNLLVRGYANYDPSLKFPFQVGTVLLGKITIRGAGASWEGAFSDAARKTNTEGVEIRPTAASAPTPGRAVRPTASAPPATPGRQTAEVRPPSPVRTTSVRVAGLVTSARNPDSQKRAS